MVNRMIDKFLSGRYYLTVICGIAFLWCVVNKILDAAATVAILTSVFKDYFFRNDRGVKENGDSQQG